MQPDIRSSTIGRVAGAFFRSACPWCHSDKITGEAGGTFICLDCEVRGYAYAARIGPGKTQVTLWRSSVVETRFAEMERGIAEGRYKVEPLPDNDPGKR